MADLGSAVVDVGEIVSGGPVVVVADEAVRVVAVVAGTVVRAVSA